MSRATRALVLQRSRQKLPQAAALSMYYMLLVADVLDRNPIFRAVIRPSAP